MPKEEAILKPKITIAEKESSYPYTVNGDAFRLFAFGVFKDEVLVGAVATNGRGRRRYRAVVLRNGECLASEGFGDMKEAVQFIAGYI